MSSIVEVEIVPDPGSGTAVVLAPTDLGTRQGPLLDELNARLRTGLADPYPAYDLRILLLDIGGDARGPRREVLDLEALSVACRKALAAAGPVLLEPLMEFAVTTPSDTLSGVLADLKSRSAEIEHVETAPGGQRCDVRGVVPLAAVLGYATELRSLTRGLGTLALTPHGYRRVVAP
jgi:elongation factor G